MIFPAKQAITVRHAHSLEISLPIEKFTGSKAPVSLLDGRNMYAPGMVDAHVCSRRTLLVCTVPAKHLGPRKAKWQNPRLQAFALRELTHQLNALSVRTSKLLPDKFVRLLSDHDALLD